MIQFTKFPCHMQLSSNIFAVQSEMHHLCSIGLSIFPSHPIFTSLLIMYRLGIALGFSVQRLCVWHQVTCFWHYSLIAPLPGTPVETRGRITFQSPSSPHHIFLNAQLIRATFRGHRAGLERLLIPLIQSLTSSEAGCLSLMKGHLACAWNHLSSPTHSP